MVNLSTRPGRSPSNPTRASHDLGGFILIDRLSNATLGCGMIRFAHCVEAQNIHWQALEVHKDSRESRCEAQESKAQAVLWFTGLSGAGKSTIANLVEKKLHADEPRTRILLDGDNVRHGSEQAISVSPMRTGWRTSAAWPRWPSLWPTPG